MRLAYFVMVHHKPRQLRWLLGAIANRLLSLSAVFFQRSDIGRWIGDVLGI